MKPEEKSGDADMTSLQLHFITTNWTEAPVSRILQREEKKYFDTS